jgi:outer membrane protein assembly factor BamD
MGDGSYDKAVKYFEILEARYPYGRYAQQAQIEIAYAYYKASEPASAIAACRPLHQAAPQPSQRRLRVLPEGPGELQRGPRHHGLHQPAGPVGARPQGGARGLRAFKDLVTRFPNSKYAADATARMKYLVNALASHEVHVARYYMKRGAYVAAANRAQFAVKTYLDAPANEEALFIMVKAYDALGLEDLRDDAERVMRTNFPSSDYYKRGLDRKEPWWKLW